MGQDLAGLVVGAGLVLVLVGALVLAAHLARSARARPRKAFVAEYGDLLPPEATVTFHPSDAAGFVLAYPVWAHPRRDGCRDARHARNSVQKPLSYLRDGDLQVTLDDPFRMYALVQALRSSGVDVPLCAEERAKDHARPSLVAARAGRGAPLVFGGTPLEFEYFCADLFGRLGYTAEATGAGSDGGVDVRMVRAGLTYVVECKLYASANGVGRPVVQKLVGAQMAEGADRALFVTTSFFTRPAIEYAAQMGVRLIDGAELATLVPEDSPDRGVAEEVLLSESDIWAHYPADLRLG